jgi:hypothetical protein
MGTTILSLYSHFLHGKQEKFLSLSLFFFISLHFYPVILNSCPKIFLYCF